MELVAEALHGIWGAVRLIRRDPKAFDEFNVTADGFWRSFAAILPTAILAWPCFLSLHQLNMEAAIADGKPLPDSSLLSDYVELGLAFIIWPVAAALLAKGLGVLANYARYLIAYNWISVPATAVSLAFHLLHLSGALGWQITAVLWFAVFIGLVYLSWYVALRGFETTPLIAIAFVLAEYGLSFAIDAAIR